MSKIKVDRISNRAGTGAPEFVNGIKIVGITSVGDIVGAAATFNSVSIGGTLTYEDVTNIDSVGLITARRGIVATGVITATSYIGDASNMTNAGISAGKSVGLTAFLGC